MLLTLTALMVPANAMKKTSNSAMTGHFNEYNCNSNIYSLNEGKKEEKSEIAPENSTVALIQRSREVSLRNRNNELHLTMMMEEQRFKDEYRFRAEHQRALSKNEERVAKYKRLLEEEQEVSYKKESESQKKIDDLTFLVQKLESDSVIKNEKTVHTMRMNDLKLENVVEENTFKVEKLNSKIEELQTILEANKEETIKDKKTIKDLQERVLLLEEELRSKMEASEIRAVELETRLGNLEQKENNSEKKESLSNGDAEEDSNDEGENIIRKTEFQNVSKLQQADHHSLYSEFLLEKKA